MAIYMNIQTKVDQSFLDACRKEQQIAEIHLRAGIKAEAFDRFVEPKRILHRGQTLGLRQWIEVIVSDDEIVDMLHKDINDEIDSVTPRMNSIAFDENEPNVEILDREDDDCLEI